MKHSDLVAAIWLGLSLSAVGCGGATGSSELDSLGSATQEMQCQDCDSQKSEEPRVSLSMAECPSVLPEPADAWSIECKYKLDSFPRCAYAIPPALCASWQRQALAANLVTQEGYNYLVSAKLCPSVQDYNPPYGEYHIVSICPEGCFESSTKILNTGTDIDGQWAWTPAEEITGEHLLASLSSEASLDAPFFTVKPISYKTKGPEEQALFVFVLTHGRTLKVTQNHGMLLADGRMVKASDVSVGDAFLGVDGIRLDVTEIRHEMTSKDVYNFRVDSSEVGEHIIGAEGVLVGDLAWQGDLSHELGSINLRK